MNGLKRFAEIFPLGITVLLALMFHSVALLAEPEWKAGLAQVKITPEMPVFMAGYASRDKPSEGKITDLYAKVLALEDSEGHRGVLVTSDLIGFRAEFAEPMCERIMAKTGLNRAQILLNSSHTHTGPDLTVTPGPSSKMSEQEAKKLVAYTRRLQDQVVHAVELALSRLDLAQLSWGTGVAKFVMNRREYTERGVILGVNPRGPVDRTVPVLRVATPNGKLRAVLFGAACHNTTLTGKHYKISGDYAGFAQKYIQAKLPSVQAMFMLGCAADANPYPRGTVQFARQHGRGLGKEVLRVLEEKLQLVGGPLRVEFDRVNLPLQAAPSRQEIEKLAGGRGWRAWVGGKMMEMMDRGEKLPTHYSAPIAVWQFGRDLTLIGLSGEVVVDYVRLLEKVLGPRQLWIAAYCNDVFGYLPSAQVLSEGGYETRGLIHGGIGFFAPTVQDVVMAKVLQLAHRAGRDLAGIGRY
ncbi:neutral/alkaline non-lysosomal ceramidase N-terminal domain-containing protein [Acidobacteria bacterium AH-259-G07]|nr:neutral/alkaline non-lysosomal ceramidase N-terminal domain-containing protein [Acidobacteria bacterium AH-259-G07]